MKLNGLLHFLPQPSDIFTQIYLPYLWHFATLGHRFVARALGAPFMLAWSVSNHLYQQVTIQALYCKSSVFLSKRVSPYQNHSYWYSKALRAAHPASWVRGGGPHHWPLSSPAEERSLQTLLQLKDMLRKLPTRQACKLFEHFWQTLLDPVFN